MGSALQRIGQYYAYLRDYYHFSGLYAKTDRRLPFRYKDRNPRIAEKNQVAGFDRHYLYHTAWAARIVARRKPARHVDISSNLYFSALVSAFVPVELYEFSPPELQLDNLSIRQGTLSKLPFADQGVDSISCMHVVEHIGLGRYGDALDPDGDRKAIAELMRVVAPGGMLLFVVPVGRPRICFNAHRMYGFFDIPAYFDELRLVESALIPNNARYGGLLKNPDRDQAETAGCGCYWFSR